MKWVALGAGVVGSAIGIYSAWFGITKGSGDVSTAGNSSFVSLGIAALALAALASIVALALRRRPGLAALLMLLCGVAGYGASLLSFPRTLYFAALPCWFIGAVLLMLSARKASQTA